MKFRYGLAELLSQPSVCVSCSIMSDPLRPHGLWPTRFLCPWNPLGKNTGADCHFLLQGNLPDPGIEAVSPAWQVDSLSLSHLGSQLVLNLLSTTVSCPQWLRWLLSCLLLLADRHAFSTVRQVPECIKPSPEQQKDLLPAASSWTSAYELHQHGL